MSELESNGLSRSSSVVGSFPKPSVATIERSMVEILSGPLK